MDPAPRATASVSSFDYVTREQIPEISCLYQIDSTTIFCPYTDLSDLLLSLSDSMTVSDSSLSTLTAYDNKSRTVSY
jgi:hypothetical protein